MDSELFALGVIVVDESAHKGEMTQLGIWHHRVDLRAGEDAADL